MTWDLFNSVAGSRYWVAAGWTMLHFLWVGLAMCALALVLRRLLDRAAPQVRYAVVVACFAALAIVPLPLYRWTLGRTAQPVQSIGAEESSQRWSSRPSDASAPTIINISTATQPPLITRVESALHRLVPWMPLIWTVGVPFTLTLLAGGLVGAQNLRTRARALTDAELIRRFARLREALAVRRDVALAVCQDVAAPVLLGVLRPIILLPPSILTGLAPQQLELVLIHELAHVRRWDNLVNLIQRLVEGVLFFHPAVWVVSRWVRLEREHCCDAVVLRHAAEPRAYVETLASLAMPGVAPRFAAAAMANHQLVSRVRRILNLEDQPMCLSRPTLGLVTVFALLIGLAGIAATFANVPKPQSPPQNQSAAEQPIPGVKPAAPAELFLFRLDAPANHAHAPAALPAAAAQQKCATCHNGPAQGAGLVALANGAACPAAHAGVQFVNENDFRPAPAAQPPQQADRAWGPEQATGAPDVPRAADDAKAWASLGQDNRDEWLELSYAPTEAGAILIYESYNPGAVSEVIVIDDKGARHSVFKGQDPSAGTQMATLVVTLPRPMTVVGVRLEIASTQVPGWNEIDAVGLFEPKTGKVAWAQAARASTTYAEQNGPQFEELVPEMPRRTPKAAAKLGWRQYQNAAQPQVAQLQRENQKLRGSLDRRGASRVWPDHTFTETNGASGAEGAGTRPRVK